MYNEGISISGDLIDLGLSVGVISKNGNSYAFQEEKLGVGRENSRHALRANPKLMKTIRKAIEEKVKAGEEEALRV
jgi:recombination protein RecA